MMAKLKALLISALFISLLTLAADPTLKVVGRSGCIGCFGALETSLPGLRVVWSDPELKPIALRFLREGLLAKSPALANELTKLTDSLMARRPPLSDDEIYAKLRTFIVDNDKEYRRAFQQDDASRIKLRVDQLVHLGPEKPSRILDIGQELQYLDPEKKNAINPFLARNTPMTYFNEANENIKSRAEMFGKKTPGKDTEGIGLSLEQMAGLLASHGPRVEVHHVDKSVSDDSVRRDLKRNLATRGDFVIVNYTRKALAPYQTGGGHISPVGA